MLCKLFLTKEVISVDALTHALIGLAVGGLSGQVPSVDLPLYLAVLLGSQAPDFDIVTAARGGMTYMKQHRAASHSLLGAAFWAAVIATGIHAVLPQLAWLTLWRWTLAGALSHIAVDTLNTHGAALLWPLCTKRLSLPLLPVFDPVLFMIFLTPVLAGPAMNQLSGLSFAAALLYLMIRLVLRQAASRRLQMQFPDCLPGRLMIIPSLQQRMYWDYILETPTHYVTGSLGLLSAPAGVSASLLKEAASPLLAQAETTGLAGFFRHFTPFAYFETVRSGCETAVKISDLRYFGSDGFRHSGLLVYDNNESVAACYVMSYGRTWTFTS